MPVILATQEVEIRFFRPYLKKKKKKKKKLGGDSTGRVLVCMHKALGSVPRTEKNFF
jgi:hypothetical protein